MDIRLVDMHIRDERALDFFKARMNPETRLVEGVTQTMLAQGLGCGWATAQRIIYRLEAAGYVRRVKRGTRTPGSSIIEICQRKES